MNDNLKLALQKTGVVEGDVLDWHEYEDRIVFVVVQGHKHIVPLNQLTEQEPAEELEEALPVAPEPDPASEPTLDDMPYRDLQSLAREYGIKANQSAEALRDELEAVGYDV